MKVITDEKKIDEILSTGVEDIFVKEHLKKQLMSGKVLRVKFGIDPTGPKIHLGRAIPLRKLRAFQDLGHKAVLIVGDFTATIGDPSDKLEKRPMLTTKQIKENMKDYKKQIGKIIDLKKAEFVYNSKWLGKLGFKEISELAESFSLQQMSKRRNFQDRLEKDEEISLRELFYPLMQGYDSVAVKSDIELGGFDQLFNVKAGRTIQKHYGMPEQDILTVQMLEGTDGRKMSTSWGNVITIVDEPNDMYGKVMSVKDELLSKYFLLCTDIPMSQIKDFEKKITEGMNPKDFKMGLAYEIVKIYHGAKKAKEAQENFVKTFSKKEIPDEIEEVKCNFGETLADFLVLKKILSSKGEWRRLVEQNAIHDLKNDSRITDVNFRVLENLTLKIGKKRFLKILVK
ncbi:MAG: tyrosine--tRNA ligase [Candidatus Nomurabacteria bacterium]|nr:tyrosine--tRNA ligase [Candidatus Nomurabacteria bacterium]